MDKSISLIAGIKEVAGNGTNVLYAKAATRLLILRKKTMFGKPCIVMIELLQN
jgi:hypothetical protein